jgi:hypothetical protein
MSFVMEAIPLLTAVICCIEWFFKRDDLMMACVKPYTCHLIDLYMVLCITVYWEIYMFN